MDFMDMPQIGPIDVEPDVIAAKGEPLDVLLARLGAPAPNPVDNGPDDTEPVPSDGWRVLDDRHGFVLGAPADGDGARWRVARLDVSSDALAGGRLHVYPDQHALRPSRRNRGRGLELRWPEVTRSDPDLDHLWIDVVNTGDERWIPNGDGFYVTATLVGPGRDGGSFAFVAGREGESAVPLDPGEHGRVRARLAMSGLDDLEPAEYEVHAWLMDLSIRTSEPLRVQLTPEWIARRRAEAAPRRPPPDERAHLESRLAMLRAMVAARAQLPQIVELLLEPSPDRGASIDRIAELLGCSPADARGVYMMSLDRFDRHGPDRLAMELQQLERALSGQEAPGG
ncbi:hypothetical protein GE115_09555 [Agromyces sp. CFH 90414]|uniref:Uncharacterized protein n=1 Tax=Agromyces agglutinans TaxID=2662258 RepID=A0A6I2F782_9MICO|nr:hypothetical protein [Agromyces agglutinans]MRG60114.1 hypothetical protein [Agromyces agglutinans]